MNKLIFLLAVLFSGNLFAQPPKFNPSSEMYQKIKKLNVLGSVLYVAAHPDDENTRLIAYFSNGKLYRTAYLSMTRGDGGQNLIGDEQGVELGLIRTQELLSARGIDGGEQFFTRAFDFGFSKGPEETFQIWGEKKILSDVVWIIRKYRPDVIITRFPTTGEGGHGHHTASAILAGEAFDAAGDSTKFPEQLKEGVKVWQAKRLLWNTFSFGSINTIRYNQFKINAGGYNTLLGESYGEMAAQSRSQHKSQGFGVSASRGVQYEYFKTIKGSEPRENLFDGIDVTWNRIGQGGISLMVDDILKNFSIEFPEKSVPDLLKLYSRVSALPSGYWRNQKLKEISQIVVECSGFFMEAFSRRQFFIPGEEMNFFFSSDNRLGIPVRVESIQFLGNTLKGESQALGDSTVNWDFEVKLPSTMLISQPYWLRAPMTSGSYTVNDQQLIGKPQNDPLHLEVTLNFDGTDISYNVPIRYKYSDPVKGEVYQPVFIVPPVEIKSVPDIAVSENKTPVKLDPIVTKNDSSAVVEKVSSRHNADVVESGKNIFYVNKKNQAEEVYYSAKTKSGTYDQYKVLIDYPHIPNVIYFPLAQSKLVGVDLKTAGKKAGYIPGAGDKIPDALKQLGYDVTTLKPNDFTLSNLSRFDVIVSGVRAYNIHEWLNGAYPVLMDYVRQGGVLFVQYNTNNNIGPVKAKIGPFPFSITRTRVTDEDAPVNFLDPGNGLLHYPNQITEKDFDGWIQERSTYHAANFAGNYKALFSMHDKGESPNAGGLIYCNYGKGRFVYSGLVFFRELPAGNPGAYRLFSNLIAKPKL